MTTTLQPAHLGQALIESLIGETWIEESTGKTWKVESFQAHGVGYFRCRQKGSRGGVGTELDFRLDELGKKLGRDDLPAKVEFAEAPAAEPAAEVEGSDLIGKSWTDDAGDTLTVDHIDSFGCVIVLDEEGYSQSYTVDEVRELLAEEAGPPPDETADRAAALVGKEWTDSNGHTWQVSSTAPDDRGVDLRLRVVREGASLVRWLTIDQVEQCLSVIEPETPGVDLFEDEAAASQAEEPYTVDPEMAAAGAEEDEQYRNRQLDGRSQAPKEYDLPSSVVNRFTNVIRRMLADIARNGGKSKSVLTVKGGEGDEDQEFDIDYEIGYTPPKLKSSGKFWAGEELGDTGERKRQPTNQTTIFDSKPATPAPDTEPPAEEPPADPSADETEGAEEPTAEGQEETPAEGEPDSETLADDQVDSEAAEVF